MPYVGLGLHFVAAFFFALHVIRSGQQLYWLVILFSFPMLGSVVYFLAVYLPDSRLERGARRMVTAAAKAIDPERELREARASFDEAPTAQNQMRLAGALLELGHAEEAAQNYEACLKGPFANDKNIRFLAARAFLESGRNEQALAYLQGIRAADGRFRPDEVAILLARAYGADERTADARKEFESAVERFGTFEVLAEYTIWALDTGNRDTAARLQAEINRITRRWDSNNRYLNAQTLQRLETAYRKSTSAS
jgi:hypothetical protein